MLSSDERLVASYERPSQEHLFKFEKKVLLGKEETKREKAHRTMQKLAVHFPDSQLIFLWYDT